MTLALSETLEINSEWRAVYLWRQGAFCWWTQGWRRDVFYFWRRSSWWLWVVVLRCPFVDAIEWDNVILIMIGFIVQVGRAAWQFYLFSSILTLFSAFPSETISTPISVQYCILWLFRKWLLSYSLRIWITFCLSIRRTTPIMPIWPLGSWRRGGMRTDLGLLLCLILSILCPGSIRSVYLLLKFKPEILLNRKTFYHSSRLNFQDRSKVQWSPKAISWKNSSHLRRTGTVRGENYR